MPAIKARWEVMHNLIAFGPRTEIYRDGPGGQRSTPWAGFATADAARANR